MITRETLELAARAAGMNLSHWEYDADGFRHRKHKGIRWEPHEDHGQLLDLAMACKICIDPNNNEIEWEMLGGVQGQRVDCQDFPALAEAVIQAAAEQQMAKEKKE